MSILNSEITISSRVFLQTPLLQEKKKYAYALLKEGKHAFKISSFFCSPVINQGNIYKVVEL